MPGIRLTVGALGYKIQEVTGDGNCGVYAVLQGINHDVSYQNVTQGSDQWNHAVQLRQSISGYPDRQHLVNMVTNPSTQGNQRLDVEDLTSVAQHLSQQNP